MIARLNPPRSTKSCPDWHAGFLQMMPAIRRYACIAFRHLDDEAKEDAVTETIANAMVAYVRLFELGKTDVAYPTALARYAVRQIRDGRRVGTRQNKRDVMARNAQVRNRFLVHTFDRYDEQAGEWIEATIEDTATPVPDQAAFRCDFPAWLETHSLRNREIAECLAMGDTTSEVADEFSISRGRVSQLRRELQQSWDVFHELPSERTQTETPSDAAHSNALAAK
jgi:hypothetical protein